jgi:hypothetical protein
MGLEKQTTNVLVFKLYEHMFVYIFFSVYSNFDWIKQ